MSPDAQDSRRRWGRWLPTVSALLVLAVIALLIWRTDRALDVLAVVGAGVIVAVVSVLRERVPSDAAIDVFAWMIPLIGFAVTLVVVGGEATGNQKFHEVSAQVIPTLILALAIEARLFDRPSATEQAAAGITALTTLLLLCFGEFQALQSVFRDSPTDAEMAAGAITAGLLGVLVVAVLGLRPAERPLSRRDR